MDIRRADLGLLVSLDALLAERSVTGAARRLGLSQPALSAQLARLRDLMGDDILVGNAHGMVPTPRAMAVQQPLRALLQDMSDLIFAETVFDPGTSERHFHIAGTDAAFWSVLPLVLRQIGDAAPGIRITTGGLDHDQMVTAAEAGRLDLVMTAANRMPASFQTTRMGASENIVIWRQGHPVLTADQITLDEFCHLPQLHVTPVEGSFHGPIDRVLQDLGRKRRISVSISSYVLAPALVRASDYLAVLPRMIAVVDAAGLVLAPLPFAQVPPVINLGWHPRYRNDAAHRWLRQIVTEACREMERAAAF